MNLSKDFILQNENMTLKEAFSDLFETKLEVGRWYKRPHNKALFFVKEIISETTEQVSCFGFDVCGDWMNGEPKTFPDNDRPATDSEVEAALINEAKKRGFKEGVYFKTAYSGSLRTFEIGESGFKYISHFNNLQQVSDLEQGLIFDNGVWAEIIPTMKKQEAEEKLGVKII